MAYHFELTEDPVAFLAAAADHLAADPVQTTVVASVTKRQVQADERGLLRGDHPCWWVVVRDAAGAVVGVAMRTAPFDPQPVYVLSMPDEAAVAMARLVHERGERVRGVNGALPAARVLAEETARLTGGEVRVHEHLRLFELGELVVPPSPPGRLRLAAPEDAELALAWFHAFGMAAAEQAGRDEPHAGPDLTTEEMLLRIEQGVVWLWEDERGERVHLTGANPPANGVTRVGPVFTPVQHRGRGYASAAVAEVSRQYLEQGVRCCLFTDQANPTSNRIYQALGYRPVVDMVNLQVIRR
jgi:predicted GNAT family acetyltransferase